MNIFPRYAVELTIIISDAVFIFLPVRDSLRWKPCITFTVSGVLMLCYVLAASWVCAEHLLPLIPALVASVTFLFLVFCLSVKVSLGRKLFCFFNAVMLGGFCLLYSTVLMASYEAENVLWVSVRLLSLESGIMSLLLSVLAGCTFLKVLTEELPMLLKEEYMNSIWDFMFFLPLGATLLITWMTPVWPKYFLIGRVRSFALILMPLIPLTLLLVYHLLWRTAANFSEGARLQQENTLLTMEGKRYRELRAYMDETRAMRHDFRHHILVITHLAGAGKQTELQNYLKQFADASEAGYTGYCGNIAADAIASHYTAYADALGADIEWHMDLPAELPLNESEYCAVLGNLVENALKAVKNLPEGERWVKVISALLSETIIGLSVENPFSGRVEFGRDGLPSADREGHGTGLMSVRNIVKRHQGSMNITAENSIFSVDIVFYCSQ